MKTIAKELSKDFPLVRVDFYNLKDKLLVGELTFYPNAGLTKYEPIEWDYKFGEMIDLNKIPKEHLAHEWIDILNKDQTRPDQTRPDQTRPDQTRPEMIYKGYICNNNNYIITIKNKLQYELIA